MEAIHPFVIPAQAGTHLPSLRNPVTAFGNSPLGDGFPPARE
jgi:hypothetical protein